MLPDPRKDSALRTLARSGFFRATIYCAVLAAAFAFLSWPQRTAPVVSGQATTTCPTFTVPALTHGFTTTAQLPQGDHFLLAQPFAFTVPLSAPGLNIFQVNPADFGGSVTGVGGFDGTAPQGITYATPNSRFTALSCTDSIWDFSFLVASSGATVGDTVTFFTQGASGSPSFNIVTLTVEANGVRVTGLNSVVALYLNNRLAQGGQLSVGDFIPFVASAGSTGSRTGLLTLSYLMQAGSPLDACLQLGVSINRGAGTGAVSVLVTDVIVRRNEVAGDRARTQTGLIAGLSGGYPTGLVCPVVCPQCPVPPVKCDTFCFRSADYWLLHLKLVQLRLPNGKVWINGVNFNQAVSLNNLDAIKIALQYCGADLYGQLSPQERFNREWLAAQLNELWAACGGSPSYYNAQWSSLSCYGFSFQPIQLSNGVVISTNSMVKDLFMQAFLASQSNRFADFAALADLFALFNGNDPLGVCNTP
ncbi:MAG: hypothetical protein HYR56_07915 [Acidobacteria bacterium]|nr:hypothetical protein [Acidobacteriota bacterium]